ncbi:RrF2 family transcriptional regulator [Huintestinicola sp.]|uniref:RrF2 family transcriptional regulator n=1 Tax=Huintestinicola sp. TaxID=2981661 RepID=UPI003D7E9061
MLVTTKGRYALQVMIDLAEHYSGKCIPVKDIAGRQELSIKYLEQIMPVLTKGDLVFGVHGKNGGYRLKRPPEKYSVGEILRVAEGNLVPVSSMKENNPSQDNRTMKMWEDFYKLTNDYFDSITIASLIQSGEDYDYVI